MEVKIRLMDNYDVMKIECTNDRFCLRGWELTDVNPLVEHINNIKIWNNVRDGLPYPYRVQDAQAFIRMSREKVFLQDFSIVVDGKAGFKKQAVLRNAAIKNGEVIDMHYFDLESV